MNFYLLRRSCYLLLALGVLGAALLGEAQPVGAAQKTDLATLQTSFEKQSAAAKLLPAHTKERADAMLQASQLASDIAWQLFEAKRSADAAAWFERRGALKAEAYQHARAYWENSLATEVSEREKTFASRIRTWQAELGKSTTDQEEKQNLQASIGAVTRMLHIERYNAITMLESLARDHDDASAYLKYTLQELEVRRGELANLEKLQAPASELAIKNSELAKAYERVASARADLAYFPEASKNYEQALTIRMALPADLPERELHETYSALASMYFHDMGEYVKAVEYYQLALKVFEANAELRRKALDAEKSNDNRDMKRATVVLTEANILANLGSVSQELGDYRLAREYLDRALQLSLSLPKGGYLNFFDLVSAVIRARALTELARLHMAVGETDKAAKELEETVSIKRALGNDESTANALMQAAYLHYQLDEVESAKRNTLQAQQIFRQAQKLQSVVSAGALLSTLAREAGDVGEAARHADEILPLARQSGSANILSGALRTVAATRLEQKRLTEASTLLEEAARYDARVGSTLDKISTLHWQARVLEAQNQNEAAIAKYQEALMLLEGVRATSNSESFGEVQANYKIYERLVLLLVKANRGEEAFDVMSRARSKKMQDDLRLTSLKTSNKALQQLLDQATALEVKLQAVRGQLQNEQAKSASVRDNAKVRNLQNLVASTQGEYRRVLEDIKTKNPNYEKILTVNPKQLREAQRSIPADVALVQYAPLTEHFYIFVVTRDAVKIYAPPVKTADLWQRIQSVRKQIVRPKANPTATRGVSLAPVESSDQSTLRENLTALHGMLIAPIEEAIADKNTLAFIPTQLLYYLPMQALAREENGKLKYLIEEKQVVYLSAADVVKIVQVPDENRFKAGLVAFGDPTGADLPAAREEVQTISKIFPEGKSFVGAEVTEATVTDASTLGQRFVHFATHGILNARAPDQSYIQLANASTPAQAQLTVGEVWDLPLQRVDLVTLSACQTALGEGEPTGGEITTLAEAFSSAGAQAVVASLWSVADESTRDWMVEFYTQLAAGKPKAEAYRSAQLKLLQSAEYSHPYYWAPFVLMGDWR